jgi:DNA-binding response OmpR family regulator
MDGFETAMRIRERPRTQDIPIIFITAISQEPHHALRGYSTGAVDYIFKPFDPWALRTKVSVLIELHHLRGADARLEELTRSVEGSLTELVGSLDQLSAQELGPAAADAITLARGVVERLRALTRQVDAIQTRGDPERPSDRA